MRRLDERIDVREAPDGDGWPSQFIWRGRLYVVRSVVDHWRERRAWWRDLVDGTLPDPQATSHDEHHAGHHAGQQPGRQAGGVGVLAPASLEHEVWRVEASPGRVVGSGVYDLRKAHGGWHLVRLAD